MLSVLFPGPTGSDPPGDKRKVEAARLQQRYRSTPANSHWWREKTGSRFSASIGWMPLKNPTANQVKHIHTWSVYIVDTVI